MCITKSRYKTSQSKPHDSRNKCTGGCNMMTVDSDITTCCIVLQETNILKAQKVSLSESINIVYLVDI